MVKGIKAWLLIIGALAFGIVLLLVVFNIFLLLLPFIFLLILWSYLWKMLKKVNKGRQKDNKPAKNKQKSYIDVKHKVKKNETINFNKF